MEIQQFSHDFAGPPSIAKNPNIHSYIMESIDFIKSNKTDIIQIFWEQQYYETKACLCYVLCEYLECKVFDSIQFRNVHDTHNNNKKINKSIQLNHIQSLKYAFDAFLNPKCGTKLIKQSHFLIQLIQVLYQIEVANNGANINQEIVIKLIKLGKLTIRGHQDFARNQPIYELKDCYVTLSDLCTKFGKYILTMNKYYDSSKRSEYILKNGIKYLKYAIAIRDKHIKNENDDLRTKIDSYWKLEMGYLCLNKPNKAKRLLTKHIEIMNEYKIQNDATIDINDPMVEINFIKMCLKMYEKSGDHGHKFMLKWKKDQWIENVLVCSNKMYATKEYFAFYNSLLNNDTFWFIMRNLALFQECIVCKRKDKKLKICSKCKKTKYCSRKCQKYHWKTHKLVCLRLTN